MILVKSRDIFIEKISSKLENMFSTKTSERHSVKRRTHTGHTAHECDICNIGAILAWYGRLFQRTAAL